MAALPYKETISITLPTGFSDYKGLAVKDSKIYILAKQNSPLRLYILRYPLTGGGTPEAQLQITPSSYFNTTNTFALDTAGTGFVVVQNKTVSLLNASAAESDYEQDSAVLQMLGVTYDADNTRFIVLVRDYVSGNSNFMRFAIYGSDLERTSFVDIGAQSSTQNRGMIEYSADKVWAMYGRTGRVLSVFTTQLVAETETQPISEVPSTTDVIDISYWSEALYVLADDGKVYVYEAAAATPDTAEPTQQLFIESPYFQKFAVVRQASPLKVLTFSADMLASSTTELFRFLVAGDVTLPEVLKNVAIVPKWTIPEIEEGDKVFLYSGESAPTTIPDDALNVEGIQRVGTMQRQIIYVKKPSSQ